jgi:hypothetical protein
MPVQDRAELGDRAVGGREPRAVDQEAIGQGLDSVGTVGGQIGSERRELRQRRGDRRMAGRVERDRAGSRTAGPREVGELRGGWCGKSGGRFPQSVGTPPGGFGHGSERSSSPQL